MRKISLFLFFAFVFASDSNAQLMATKMLGKGASKYGLGYGLFTYLDFPLANENQSFRIELVDFAFFPSKGENIFTTTADAIGYVSIKLGYKYVFSETQSGFYLLPSAGYCSVILMNKGEENNEKGGIAAALEGGYILGVGENGNSLNFGFKYEYDYAGATHKIQSLGARVSYAFGLFRKNKRGIF